MIARAFVVIALTTCLAFPIHAQEEIDTLLDAWVNAIGGAEAVGKVERLEYRGTIVMAPGLPPAPIVVRLEKPDKYRMKITLPAGSTLNLFDGEQAWYRTILADDPGQWEQMEVAEGLELKNLAFESAHLDHRPEVEARDVKLVEEGKLQITYPEGRDRTRVYRDGLLVEEISAEGTSRYSEYERFDGILFPTRIVTSSPLGEVITEFTEIKVNPTFPEGTFTAEP